MAENLIIYIQKILPAVVNSLQRNNRILIDCINKSIADSYDQIIFYRKILADSVLPSKDIVLTIDNLENLEYLICLYIFWVKILGLNTAIKYRRYSIAVYRINIIYINTGDPAKYQGILAEQIAAVNASRLAATPTEITYIGWIRPWKTVTRKNRSSILVVKLDSLNTANILICGGFVLDNKYFDTEYYNRDQQVLQCFGCQKYSYIKQYCRRNRACIYCTESHKLLNCSVKNKKIYTKYTNCRLKHFVFDRVCEKKQKQLEVICQYRTDISVLYTELFFIPSTSDNTTENIHEPSPELVQSKYIRNWSTTGKLKTIRNRSCRKFSTKIQPIQDSDLVENNTNYGKRVKHLHEQNTREIMEIDICSKVSTGTVLTINLKNIQAVICIVTRYKNKQN